MIGFDFDKLSNAELEHFIDMIAAVKLSEQCKGDDKLELCLGEVLKVKYRRDFNNIINEEIDKIDKLDTTIQELYIQLHEIKEKIEIAKHERELANSYIIHLKEVMSSI